MSSALPANETTASLDLPTLRARIEALSRGMHSDFDQRTLNPEALVHFHFILNALDQARIHVEAARLANER